MTPHSPTPWTLHTAESDKRTWILDVSGCYVCYGIEARDTGSEEFGPTRFDGAYIVRCVNAHEALVKYARHLPSCARFEDDGVRCKFHPEWCSCGLKELLQTLGISAEDR